MVQGEHSPARQEVYPLSKQKGQNQQPDTTQPGVAAHQACPPPFPMQH